MRSGIKRSEQEVLCNAGSTYKKAELSMKNKQTAWSNSELSKLNFIRNEYYDLIFRDSNQEKLTSYFLASRSVDLEDKYVDFGIFEVSMGKTIKTNPLFNSRGASLECWDKIRPIVEIPMSGVSIDKSNSGLNSENPLKLMNK